MIKKQYFFAFILLYGLFSFSCCEECDDPNDRDCPNYDPCFSYEAPNANFIILDTLTGWNCDGEVFGINVEVDTLFIPNELSFKAINESDSYKWKVGTDDRVWTDREFSLYFGFEGEGDIPVTLITEKYDPNGCLSTEERMDTLTKNIHLYTWYPISSNEPPPIAASYEGFNEDAPDDVFTFDLLTGDDFGLYSFPKDCPVASTDLRLSHRYFIFANAESQCGGIVCGVGELQDDNKTIIIDYSIEIDGERVEKKFIGTKI